MANVNVSVLARPHYHLVQRNENMTPEEIFNKIVVGPSGENGEIFDSQLDPLKLAQFLSDLLLEKK